MGGVNYMREYVNSGVIDAVKSGENMSRYFRSFNTSDYLDHMLDDRLASYPFLSKEKGGGPNFKNKKWSARDKAIYKALEEFDAVLAMYHDQGLVAFKTIAQGEGVNYTAGLSKVRTSPDHGTAFDIAGKNEADPNSFREALFSAIDILQQREAYATNTANPLRKAKIEVERGVV
jgi:hypothetical protein